LPKIKCRKASSISRRLRWRPSDVTRGKDLGQFLRDLHRKAFEWGDDELVYWNVPGSWGGGVPMSLAHDMRG